MKSKKPNKKKTGRFATKWWLFLYYRITSETNGHSWWIGLTDSEGESIFRWINNAPLRYEVWNEGTNELNGQQSENCVMIHRLSLKWVDVNCHNSGIVLCSTNGKTWHVNNWIELLLLTPANVVAGSDVFSRVCLSPSLFTEGGLHLTTAHLSKRDHLGPPSPTGSQACPWTHGHVGSWSVGEAGDWPLTERPFVQSQLSLLEHYKMTWYEPIMGT